MSATHGLQGCCLICWVTLAFLSFPGKPASAVPSIYIAEGLLDMLFKNKFVDESVGIFSSLHTDLWCVVRMDSKAGGCWEYFVSLIAKVENDSPRHEVRFSAFIAGSNLIARLFKVTINVLYFWNKGDNMIKGVITIHKLWTVSFSVSLLEWLFDVSMALWSQAKDHIDTESWKLIFL